MKPLDADAIFGSFDRPVLVGRQGEVVREATSAMDVARERLADGVPDGYVVLAEWQSAGRGRKGAWECAPGMGLLMSIVLRCGVRAAEQRLVAAMASVAAAEALRNSGVEARIKWPNDLVVSADDGPTLVVRKLGGVLVERIEAAGGVAAHVVGLGINVNQGKDDLPVGLPTQATSMMLERGRPCDRNAVCRAVLQELNAWYRVLAAGQTERILARWRARSCLLGRGVRAQIGDCVVAGTVLGIRSTGELILGQGGGGQLLLPDSKAQLLL